MELTDYLRILRSGWPLVAVCGVVGVVLALLTLPSRAEVPLTTTYRATAILLRAPDASLPTSYLKLYLQQGEVPQRVAERLDYGGDPQTLGTQVTLETSEDDPLIRLVSTGREGDATADRANAFAEELVAYVDEREDEETDAASKDLQTVLDASQKEIAATERQLLAKPNDIFLQAKRDALVQRYRTKYQELINVLGRAQGSDYSIFELAEPVPVVSGGFVVPVRPVQRSTLFGGVGLLLGLLAILLMERLDVRLRSRPDLEQAYGLGTIAVIPELPRDGRGVPPLAVTHPDADIVDAYRLLGSALRSTRPRPIPGSGRSEDVVHAPDPASGRVILLTSARPGEGATTTTANLAVVTAQAGARVLVIDGNRRDAALTGLLQVEVKPAEEGPSPAGTGVSPEFTGPEVPTSVAGLTVLPVPTPGRYRGAEPERLRRILAAAAQAHDYVLIDAAPLLAGVQTMDLLPHVDEVAIVTRKGALTTDDADRAAGLLQQLGVPVHGLIVIDAAVSQLWLHTIRRWLRREGNSS